MADPINIGNSAAALAGKTVLTAEGSHVVSGVLSFQRAPDAPFDVETGSAVVPNLDADLLDGEEGSDYHDAAKLTGAIAAGALPDPLPALDGYELTNLDATHLTGIIPDGNFPATLPAASGVNLTHLTGANIDGSIPDGAVPNPLPAVSGAALTSLAANALTTGIVPGERMPLMAKLYAAGESVASQGSTETDLFAFDALANDVPATGDGFNLEMAGSFAGNTNSKVLKLVIGDGGAGDVSLTLVTNADNVASNRWLLRLSITRDSATTCRISGILMHGAANGANPTTLFWGGYQMSGLVGWGSEQIVRITGTGVTTNDIVSSEARALRLKG